MKEVFGIKVFILLGIILIIAVAIVFFIIREKNKVVAFRDFSCADTAGFTFRYPVFKNWGIAGVKGTSENECAIFLDDSYLRKKGIDTEVAPQILVRKFMLPEDKRVPQADLSTVAKNPQGVSYVAGNSVEKNDNELIFYTNAIAVGISPLGVVDFPTKTFTKEVIRSFRLIGE